jgi:hypothetical protein
MTSAASYVEMNAHMIEEWCKAGAADLAANLSSHGVQSAGTMQAQMHDKLPILNQVAERLYRNWIHGIDPRAS